jgi:hypothetical protein
VADIEERAAKYALERYDVTVDSYTRAEMQREIILAYLAGSAQTQRDYVAYYQERGGV